MPWHFYNNRGVLKQPGIADALPVGLITAMVSIDSPVLVPPTGWLLCNGGVHSTNTYPDLAAVLSYPAAPGANFTVPNLDGDFVIGTSGTYPLNSVGGTTQHPHTINSHTHSNTHNHGVSSGHTHNATHGHGPGTHAHGGVGYNSGAATGGVTTDLTGGGSTTSSGGNHTHPVTGSTGTTADDTTGTRTDTLNSAGIVAPGGSDGSSTTLSAQTPAVTPGGAILPPFLNVYYVIKAVDFSGTYI